MSESQFQFLEGLRQHIGTRGRAQPARDAVNAPMIRHWCDAMQDGNPVYTDADFAAKSSHGELVAPPTMLNAWTMIGLIPRVSAGAGRDPQGAVLGELDAAGYSSVVATNSDHEYRRYLRIGDHLSGTLELLDVSEEKQTALGLGHFVTTQTTYHDQHGEEVGAMRFCILKFKPGTGRTAGHENEDGGSAPRVLRPRPGVSRDTEFFWDGVQRDELRIQQCSGCESLFHPPMVRCPRCGSYDLGHRVSSGRGRLYSFVEVHHPAVPAFDYPVVVGLVELEEGTRLLSEVIDLDAGRVEIGMPLEVAFEQVEPPSAPGQAGWKLPLFRAARPERRETTLRFDDVEVGQQLAPCPIPITTTRIVACAIASRDYQDVHHDRELAIQRGSPDIFMNILTSGGLGGRYITDWAGPEAQLRNLEIRLGAPNYPGDCMTMYGEVASKQLVDGSGVVEIAFRGTNRLGHHLTGKTALELPVSQTQGSAT